MNKLLIASFALYFVFLIFSPTAVAQTEVLDNNPSAMQWYQINTPKIQMIFPMGFEREANRAANTLQYLSAPVSKTLLGQPRKISIVLQNRTAISNAFVTITPRRSEFYTMPPQDYKFLGNNDWIDLLAVHEYRHVVQFDNSIVGFNKLLYYVFGAPAVSGMSHIAVPQWFWEGDAVATETALTAGGRGRIPHFDLAFRTNLLEGRRFNYNKQHLRSFKDFVPNHYVLGYHMVTHLRRAHDAEIWARVTENAFRYAYIPFTFSRALKLKTGKNLLHTYNETLDELDTLWTQQVNSLEITDAYPLQNVQQRVFTNYNYPQQLTNGKVLVLKSGIGDIEKFVTLDSAGNEEVVFTPGIINGSGMLSVEADKIVWNEFEFDPRWRARSYSVIKTYDIDRQQINKLTSKTRYAAAALSPDGKHIVTVEVSAASKYRLVILDASSGQVISSISNPENNFISMPRFSSDGKNIVAISQARSGKSIIIYNKEKEQVEEVISNTLENIGHPIMHDHYLLFSSPYNGIDNIYALNRSNDQVYQVTSRKYGAYNPSVSKDGKRLYFNDYQKDGMTVAVMPFDTTQWVKLDKVKKTGIQYYDTLVAQEQNQFILSSIPEEKLPIKKYNKLKSIFNPYGWGPIVSTGDREFLVGITSQDVLSTTLLMGGYVYNANESTGYGFGQVSYQGLYPIIDLSARVGNRSVNQAYSDTTVNVTWNETGLSLGSRIPLVLTRSSYFENLTFSSRASLTRVSNYSFDDRFINQLSDGTLQAVNYRVSYNRLLKRSQRDLNSKFGQALFLHFTHTPLGGNYKANLFAAEGNLFFPGLFKHHSLRLRGGFQHENVENYVFSTPLFFPRGYGSRSFQYFYNTAIEYKLPLWYPDLSIGPFLNFQRIKANLFYDYGRGIKQNFTEVKRDITYHSLGLDITTDFNIMRFFPLYEAGIRYLYLPETNSYSFQVILGQFGF